MRPNQSSQGDEKKRERIYVLLLLCIAGWFMDEEVTKVTEITEWEKKVTISHREVKGGYTNLKLTPSVLGHTFYHEFWL